jgi:hypothetical protein
MAHYVSAFKRHMHTCHASVILWYVQHKM